MAHDELEAIARDVIDTNHYMVLGTADPDGRPWVSPVYFTPERYGTLYWASSPQARHSRNIAGRPEVSVVIFDSRAPIGGAEAVYMSARAEQVPDDELERCAEVYRNRLPEVRDFGLEQLRPPAEPRLYRATVAEHSILIRGSDPQHGRGVDSRMRVTLTG